MELKGGLKNGGFRRGRSFKPTGLENRVGGSID